MDGGLPMKALAKTKKEPGIWMIDAPKPEYSHNDPVRFGYNQDYYTSSAY